MKIWPVPESYCKTLPEPGISGSFWENRGDRFHCGVDIYAPHGSCVLSIEPGKVIETGLFTSPGLNEYWNDTYYAVIEHASGIIAKYAEMGSVTVKAGEMIDSGSRIGDVGTVLKPEKISKESPLYINRLKEMQRLSMLHLEIYDELPVTPENYLGGNVFTSIRPENLLNPAEILLTD